MNRARFERIVDDALAELPAEILERVDNLHVVVEDWPTAEQDPAGDSILGIYEGVALADRGVDYFGVAPDRIVIFRGPHTALGLAEDDLRAEIRKTVLHEIAHHLGIDEQRLHELGWG